MPGLRPLTQPAVSAGPAVLRNVPPVLTPDMASAYIGRASNLGSDEQKYQAAVDLARIDLQNKEKVSDNEFKKTIDTYYDQFNPEKTGREMRGENQWTDFVGGARDAINGVNNGIGTAIDTAVDTMFATPMEFMGANEAAKDFRNMMSGEDWSILPDILTDVALTATGVGIPAVIAKNAIQLSPQMAQGLSGKDSVTLEELSPEQQIANAALGFGGTALSAIPGVGKATNIAKRAGARASEDAFQAAQKTLNETMEEASKKALNEPVKKVPFGADETIFTDPDVVKAFRDFDAAKAINDADGTFGRVLEILKQDAAGFGDGVKSIPSVISETHAKNKGKATARKLSREANDSIGEIKTQDLVDAQAAASEAEKVAKSAADAASDPEAYLDEIERLFKNLSVDEWPKKLPGDPKEAKKLKKAAEKKAEELAELEERSKNPAERFKGILEREAKEKGVSVKDLAEELGVDFDNLPVKMSDRKMKAAGRKGVRKAEADAGEPLTKQQQKLAYDSAVKELASQSMLDPKGFKGMRPLGILRGYADDVLESMMENTNRGARNVVDEASSKRLAKSMEAQLKQGKRAALERAGRSVQPLGARARNVAGGMVSAYAGLPLAEMAQSGGSYIDAVGSMADRIQNGEISNLAFLPMMLTGSKQLSKAINPGLRGKVGESSIPHNAMRGLGSVKRWDQLADQYSTANEGYIAALNNLIENERQNKEEE